MNLENSSLSKQDLKYDQRINWFLLRVYQSEMDIELNKKWKQNFIILEKKT